MKCIFFLECIDIKYGKGYFNANAQIIIKKCNQKCLDVFKRLKREKAKNEK